jgi:hypothetical protein
MFDMVALAYQANLTRIFTFMMAAEVSNMTYNHIGVSDAFHPVSHHQNDPKRMDTCAKIQTYNTSVFAKFLTKLQKTPDGDGSLLDHSIMLFGSNMSNSNAHNHAPLPSAIVSGWKAIKGNQHLKYPDQTTLGNLLLTMLDKSGVPGAGRQHSVGDLTCRDPHLSQPCCCSAASHAAAAESLAVVVRNQQPARALEMLDARTDVNYDEDGTSALQWAVHYGYGDLIDQLLKSRADVCHVNDLAPQPCRRRWCARMQASSVPRCARGAVRTRPMRGPDGADADSAHGEHRSRAN